MQEKCKALVVMLIRGVLVYIEKGKQVAIIVRASAVAATTARTSATMGQGGTCNCKRFQTHHPPTYMGGGDSMVRTALAIEREVKDARSI